VRPHDQSDGQLCPSPEDISRTVGYLASDDLRWVTGVVIPVDPGNVNSPF
jgi:NAD(P)-dependent dehydrogenase (short-subunit alcohol dehydrogenase family)